ncbi:MAG: hypothetical protein ACMG57_00850 [Candidatus Dojkabacteria bacterium]
MDLHDDELNRLFRLTPSEKLEIAAEVDIVVQHLWSIGVVQTIGGLITYDSVKEIPEILELFDLKARMYGLSYPEIWDVYCKNYLFLARS